MFLGKSLAGAVSRTVSSSSRQSVPRLAKSRFHSSALLSGKPVENDKRYTVTDNPAEFPVQNFEEYRRTGDATSNKLASYGALMAASATGGLGIKSGVVDLLGLLNQNAVAVAASTMDFDTASVPEGTTITIKWKGKPVFVRHRTQAEIQTELKTPMYDLKEPQADEDRRKKPEFILLIGICTHLGCVPLSNAGEFNGWFCPCHGSHYDTAGRIRKGPAPRNLELVPHRFDTETELTIGVD